MDPLKSMCTVERQSTDRLLIQVTDTEVYFTLGSEQAIDTE